MRKQMVPWPSTRRPTGHLTGGRDCCKRFYMGSSKHRQEGAFAIMTVPLLILLVIFCGLALNAGSLYNRKVELSGMAKAVALAAANELNGTTAGIVAAQAKAAQTAQQFSYHYGLPITWNDAALTFGTSADRTGDWRPSSGISDASTYYFAKVDASGLDMQVSTVRPIFVQLFSSSAGTTQVDGSAVAGRASVNVAPIAICAMSDYAAGQRINTGLAENELIEYGFRRGVSYDLMRLNPKSTVPARFLVNPVAAPGGASSSFDTSIVGPFACTGTMWIPRLTGGPIHVTSLPATSPLQGLYTQLNSRLDDYTGSLCSPNSAPPDTNIKTYPNDVTGGAPWMVPTPGSRAAASTTERGKLETVADIPPPGSTLAGLTAASYGPLWAFAKAVKYSSYQAGVPEPATGYTPFNTTDWGKLYKSGVSANATYPTSAQSTPYNPVGVASPTTVASPSASRKNYATQYSRVLYVPLLSCASGAPSGSNVTASVAGIGKFFMTVPATQDNLIAEFAGTIQEKMLTGQVELYP